jgi:ABC-2 type transport system permease protein
VTIALTRPAVTSKLSFPGVVTSEWIKFFSLRSTYWVLSLFVFVTAGFNAIACLIFRSEADADFLGHLHVSEIFAQMTSMVGTLVVGILGVLTITNEYGSGMIRSSLTAVPRRLPVFWAKALVLLAVSAVVSALTVLLSYGAAYLSLRDRGVDLALVDGENWRVNLGIVLYIVTMTLLGLTVGTLVRSTPGAMAIVVGLAFVLPVIASIVYSFVVGTSDAVFGLWRKAILYIIEILPSNAGTPLLTYDLQSADTVVPTLGLGPWSGLAVMWAWVVAFGIAGLIRLQTRDA